MNLGDVLTALGIGGVAVYAFLQGAANERRLTDAVGELKVGLAELKVALIGPDGENGMRGDVREVKSKVAAIEDQLNEHTTKLALLDAKPRTAKRRRAA